jgi:hypothetical protein
VLVEEEESEGTWPSCTDQPARPAEESESRRQTRERSPGRARGSGVGYPPVRGECAAVTRARGEFVRSAETTEGRAGAGAGLPLHGRGLLGSRVDDSATGVQLRLRQAVLRSPARGTRAAGARASLAEPRAAATFPPGMHGAAAVITYLSPGLRLLHQGQFEGQKKAHLAVPGPRAAGAHRGRAPAVLRLPLGGIPQPVVRDGQWRLLDCVPAWDGNWTSDCFIVCSWHARMASGRLVTVNWPRTGASVTSVCRFLT